MTKIKGLTIELNVEANESLKEMKELTAAVNECVEAFEKLEQVMGRFTNKNNSIEIEIPVLLNGRKIAEGVTKITETEREIASRTC
ncbi:hypothetical protein P9W85_24785 [Bacillus tropicus]|uniref:hypothetical protein n=1 Tax=Bacillus tropicus TaxID=2026188 RepID=UPI002DBB5B8D|nr:hypothetical protein [Bacillus tropicus]MEC2554536.1 hypothetical protein [Bacillus tropicus]